MLVNADFSLRATVIPADDQWVPSPQAGVERVMLDRVGGEKARATSLVRYAPASSFPGHHHPGGEEILVLSGTFSEGQGQGQGQDHYPAGWYMRNPPGSSHQPASHEGACLFVKLWQMTADETQPVRINTHAPSAWRREGDRDVCPLFEDNTEQVCLQRLGPGTPLFTGDVPGAEVLVLDGSVVESDLTCPPHSWLRLPPGRYPDIAAGPAGATVYLKIGDLWRAMPALP